VAIHSSSGEPLAQAAYSPHSNIRARVWTWDTETPVNAGFFRGKIEAAVRARAGLLTPENNSARLIHAESDGLPGVIADRYAGWLVVQFLSAGAEYWRDTLADLLVEISGVPNLYERSDADVRALEGLPPRSGVLRGAEPPELIPILENGLALLVDVRRGHKTGFYLDQAANRARVRALAGGRDVLDCFAYTGGFSAAALAGGAASVLGVESSADAVALGRRNISLNGDPGERSQWIEADVFREMRTLRDRAISFDMIILDPPKFAPTRKNAEQAARGYKDINLLAFKLLRPGGLLVTFSCSGGVDAGLFQSIVAGAAADAGAEAQIVERLSAAADHPVMLNFPEGEYLKGLVIKKMQGQV
jgi:23S rRNA (cytosine1962-C5)-methyltransferase